MSSAVQTPTDVRTFEVEIPEEQIDDLRRRIATTRWPSNELVEDSSQGVQLATLQAIARYWAEDYDFGRLGARLRAPGRSHEPGGSTLRASTRPASSTKTALVRWS